MDWPQDALKINDQLKFYWFAQLAAFKNII